MSTIQERIDAMRRGEKPQEAATGPSPASTPTAQKAPAVTTQKIPAKAKAAEQGGNPGAPTFQASIKTAGSEDISHRLAAMREGAFKATKESRGSFPTVDKKAAAYQQYEQIVQGLTTGSKYLETAKKQLDGLRSAYDAAPSEVTASAFNRCMEQFQSDMQTYADLLEQYNYFNTAEGIKKRADELRPLMETAEKKRNEAQMAVAGLARYGTKEQRDEWSAKLKTAEADYEKYSSAYNDLTALYYEVENKEKLAALRGDEAATGKYESAKELQADMDRVLSLMSYTAYQSGDPVKAEEDKKYLEKKYGLDEQAIKQYAISGAAGAYTPRSDGGYNNLYELYQELQEKQAQEVEGLAGAGYDYQRMERYAKMLRDAEEYDKKREEWQQYAKDHPILSSVETVLVSPFQGIDYLKTMAAGIGASDTRDLEHYVPMDVYNMDATNFVSEVRGTVSKEIEENTNWELFGQNVASFLYQTGMSVADSGVQVATFGSAATLFMGASAASNQAKSVIERGGTNEQAFWGGLAAGAAEVIFEKVSIDHLLKPMEIGSIKSLLRETLKQAGVEASEEMFTEITNILTDASIMGEKSDFAQLVAQYRSQGMSEEDAKRKAYLDCIGQVVWAGAGGALSGAAMGGTVAGLNYATAGQGAVNRNARKLGGEFQGMGQDVVQAIVDEGLQSAEGTESHRLAVLTQEKLAKGEELTKQELGRLYQENVAAISAEEQDTPAASLPTLEDEDTAAEIGEEKTAPQQEGGEMSLVRKMKEAIPAVQGVVDPVATVTGDELPREGKMVDRILGFIERLGGKATRPGFGDVLFSKSRVKNGLIGHGAGRAKIETFAAVPSVIQDGLEIDHQENWKGRGYDTHTFMAPITYRGQLTYLGVIVTKDSRDGKYYVHEVVDEDGNIIFRDGKGPETTSDGRASLAGAFDTVAASEPSETRVTQPGQEVNTDVEPTDEPQWISLPKPEDDMAQGGPGRMVSEDGSRETGAGLPDGGQRWAGREGAGEQAGGMAEGTERRGAPADQGRAAVERQNRAKRVRAQRVSSRELGISMGTDTPSVTVMEETEWDDAMRSAAERVRRETGREVTYVLGGIQVQTSDGTVSRARGVYTADRIIIQADNLRCTIDQIADHEIFHDKASQTPGLIREIEDRIREQYSQEELAEAVDAYIRRLRGVVDVPVNADAETIHEAMMAVMEEIFADAYAGINAFAAHAERFNETVERTLDDRGVGRAKETRLATDRTTGPPKSGERFSYGGRNANRADSESLRQAEQLERDGADPEQIRQETGWFRGMDGLWRFEMDDSGMEYSQWGDMNRLDREEFARFRELEMKFIEGALTEEETAELRALIDEGHGYGRAEERGDLKLSDFIRHEELFRNYPQLKNVRVQFAELDRGVNGTYDPGSNTITISEKLRGASEDTLIHEIQHAIQKAEGFAKGASADYWRKGENFYAGRDAQIERLRDAVAELEKQLPKANEPWTPMADAIEKEISELEDQILAAQNGDVTPESLYWNTAGEIEARDAAKRRTMTRDQRRAASPDLGDEKTVFADDAEAGYSMEEYTEQEKKEHRKLALEYFGRTFSWNETGYLLTDGKKLDFSGRHEGGPGGYRTVDHRDVRDALGEDYGGDDYSGSMVQFMAEGNIRISPESGGINLSTMPTKAQMEALDDFISKERGEVVLDIDTTDGRTVASVEYPRGTRSSKVLADIARYFENGTVPEVSDVSKFRFSMDEDSKGRALTPEQQKYFEKSKARDAYGRLLTLYHGGTVGSEFDTSRGTGKTQYGPGAYLTTGKGAAEEFVNFRGEGAVGEYYANITAPFDDRADIPHTEEWDKLEQILRKEGFTDADIDVAREWGFDRMCGIMERIRGEKETASFFRGYADEVNALIRKAGYDGIIGDYQDGVQVVAFSPKQIKRIDNTAPTVSPDTRFSVDEESRADGETEQQEKKTTKPVAESLPIIAKRDLRQNLLGLFSIPDGRKQELGTIIDQYADRLLRDGALTESDREAFFDRMYNSGIMEVAADEYYKAARDVVRGGRIYVNDQIKGDFGDDWAPFRKRAFAAGIYLTGNMQDAGVDVWNANLASMMPGLFDAENLDGKDILERIVQAAEEGKDEQMSLAEYTRMLAGQEFTSESEILDNIERQMDWALRTFAEKAKLEVKLRDRTGVKIAQEREKSRAAVERQRIQTAKERGRRQEIIQRQRQNRELRDLQQKTLKQLQWLSKNRYRAPKELKATWDEVLGDIDIFAVGAANEMNWSKKHQATWQDLAQMYKDAKENDPNFLPSKELERIVTRLDGDKIADLDVGALQDLYKAAVGLRTEFYNRNNVINDEMGRMFSEVYTDAKAEIEAAPSGYSGKKTDRFVNLEQLTPMNVLQRMGGWNPQGAFYSMAKQLEEGERAVRDYRVRAERQLEDFLTEHKEWVKKADGQGKDAIWYEVEVPPLLELGMGDKPIFGKPITVYMTPAQKVQLYLESKNYDNLRHMTGGRTFVDKDLYSQGKRSEALAQGTTIRLAPESVKALVANMTDEEMELARVLDGYYNRFAAERINRVSNILYGFDKAMGKNYAPIFTNQNYTKSEIGVYDATAEGVGHMKGRQYAVNPSYNISALDAFERHVDQTARFVGMSIPARNWNTLLNWRTKNNSTEDVITHKWGEISLNYIKGLLEELQGGKMDKRSSPEAFMDTVLSNYISSVFGFNPSIVLKQAMSFPLAGTYLGWESMPNIAAAMKTSDQLINTYTSELAYRLLGYATPETAQLKNNPSKLGENKALKFTFGGGAITAMDGWTVKAIWRWAENAVRRSNPELEAGTQEQIEAGQSPFYQEVAKRFEEAVSRSQPMYDVMHRSQIMRTSNKAVRAFTLFKTVPQQQYNMLRQTVGEAQYYKQAYEKGKISREDYVAYKRRTGRAVLGVILAGLGIEAINFLNAMVKNKGKRYRDDDEEITWASAGWQFLAGFTQDNLGMMIGGDLTADILASAVTRDNWYGLDTPGVTQIDEILEQFLESTGNIQTLVKDGYDIVANGGDLGEYFRRHGADYLGYLDDAVETVATYFGGIAAGNIKSYTLGALRWISPEVATAYEDMMETADKSGLSGLTGPALEIRVEDILKNRLGENNEETAAALAALYEGGYKTAVPTDTPGSVSVNGETVKLGAYQQQFYDRVWRSAVAGELDKLVGSGAFQGADDATKAKMLEKLYGYAAERAKTELFDDYEAQKSVEDVATVEAGGGSVADWAAFSGATVGKKNEEKFRILKGMAMPDKVKAAIVGTIVGTELETSGGDPSQYAKMQDVLKSGTGMDTYLDLKMADAVDEYLKCVDGGVSPETAIKAAKSVAEIKDSADDDATKLEMYRQAIQAGGSQDEQMATLAMLMSESEYDRLEAGVGRGITPEQYISVREAIAEINDNGNTSQDEATRAVASIPGLTQAQRATLWQLQNKGWKSKNNPFGVFAGEEAYQALHADDEPEGLTLTGLPRLENEDSEEDNDELEWISLPKLGD